MFTAALGARSSFSSWWRFLSLSLEMAVRVSYLLTIFYGITLIFL